MTRRIKNKEKAPNKMNIWLLLLGILCFGLFIMLAIINYSDRMIIRDGELRNAKIVEMNYGGRSTTSGSILIDNRPFHISKLSNDLKIGDSIQIRYDKSQKKAIKSNLTDFNLNFDLALYSMLLIIGLVLLYGGVTGKR